MAQCEDFEYTCTLSEETLEVAQKELKEDPCTRLLELKALRDRLQQYPGLKPRLDPQFLIRFLRARKFDQERAFELVLNYYRMKKENAAIFTGLKPSCLTHVFPSRVCFPSPGHDVKGRRVYRIYPGRLDTSHYSMTDVVRLEFLNLSKLIEDEDVQVRGVTILMDFKGAAMADVAKHLSPSFFRRVSALWTDAFPARMRCCLIVNEPAFMDMVMALFEQFMKTKFVERIHRVGTDWSKLHEYIDPACLPACYGGSLQQDVDPQSWVEGLLQCDREMEEEGKFGFVDYTLRSDQDIKQEDAFTNMAGTFRKLDL